VPLRPDDEPRAVRAAESLADRLASELELPVFFYGRLTADGRGPAFFRRGGLAELEQRVTRGELAPDRGAARLHPSAGAVLLGVRKPLIAFNVNLRSHDLALAEEIARRIRERDGGFPAVRALGLRLPESGLVQVSMNLEDWEKTSPDAVVERIAAEARARGVEVAGSELVGLLPAGAVIAAARGPLLLPDLDAADVLELRLLDE
jgi:glutamate formiminotransferase